MAGSLSVWAPAPAVAQALPAGCSLTGPGSLVTCRFSYTGAAQTFTVPPGVVYLFVDVVGASGGHGCQYQGRAPGGAGAELKAEPIGLPRMLGTGTRVLEVNVGGKGGDALSGQESCRVGGAGGFNGGGHGGQSAIRAVGGGGGGGASDIRFGSFGLADRWVVAAGGGGAGGDGESGSRDAGGAGGDGGAVGQDGRPGSTVTVAGDLIGSGGGGHGAHPHAGGAGGTGGDTDYQNTSCHPRLLVDIPGLDGAGHHGELARGGAGAGDRPPFDYCGGDGGGGGGGVFGGGGGGQGVRIRQRFFDGTYGHYFSGSGGGGGGGSSAGPSGTAVRITSGVTTSDGNGSVTISYYS